MTHNNAVNCLLKRHKNAILYKRLTEWNENLTISENSKNFANINNAYSFANKYGLSFCRTMARQRKYKRSISDNYRSKWNPKLTIRENAKAMKITYRNAIQIKNNYLLPYTKRYKSGLAEIVPSKFGAQYFRTAFQALAAKGINNAAIGKLYGISRERVRQILQ